MINVRPDSGYDGMTRVGVGVASVDKAITITENGTYEVSDENNYINKVDITVKTESPIIRVNYYQFYIDGWRLYKYRTGKVIEVKRGQTIDVIAGQNEAGYTGNTLSYPAMTFVGWDSPIDIIDGKITIPDDWVGDVDIYANYTFDNNYYVAVTAGSTTLTAGTTTSTSNYTIFRKDWEGMPTSESIKRSRSIIILSGDFENVDGQFLYQYSALQEIFVPMSIGFIGGNTTSNYYSNFNSCFNLKYVHLPNNLTEIGTYSFYGCMKLSEINMPSHLESIGSYAFGNCRSLCELTFPKTLNHIGAQAFNNTLLLNIVHFNGSTPPVLDDANAFHTRTRFYVPDNAVPVYKTAPIWSTMADRIFPESEYNGEYE